MGKSLFLPITVALSKTQESRLYCFLRLVRERMDLLVLPDKAQLRQTQTSAPC